MYDNDTFKKKLAKANSNKKIGKIKKNNSITIASFLLNMKYSSLFRYNGANKRINDSYTNQFFNEVYNKDVFYDYKPGILKNYFQKLNNLLINHEGSNYGQSGFLPEISKLKNKTLYVPKFIGSKYDRKSKSFGFDNQKIHKAFKNYGYKYKLTSIDEIDKKIMNNEEFYYLRYSRMVHTRMVFQVINSKTGEIIYKKYYANIVTGLKSKFITAIGNRIEKESR